ncbi:MAG: hypothetical protein ACXWRE_02775 [Pseudobdellovibrionaceae bacterium]
MKPSFKWGFPIIIICLSILAVFQNCVPTSFKAGKSVTAESLGDPSDQPKGL